MNKLNLQAFHGMRNVIEQDNRRFFYFYNENFRETHVDDKALVGKGLDSKLQSKVFKTFEWYSEHFAGLAEATDQNEPIVYLLTSNPEAKAQYLANCGGDKNLKAGVIDMNDFITAHQADFPELINFLGFLEEGTQQRESEIKLEEEQSLYGDHLEMPDLILGIKEGRYFQGRLMVSRLTQEEASVSV